MPQIQNSLHVTHLWRNPFSHFQPLLPLFSSWVKRGKFWNKINITSCKWSNFNASSSEHHLCYPLLDSSLFHFQPLLLLFFNWVKSWEILEQNKSNNLKMDRFECFKFRAPFIFSPVRGISFFPIFSLCCFSSLVELKVEIFS